MEGEVEVDSTVPVPTPQPKTIDRRHAQERQDSFLRKVGAM